MLDALRQQHILVGSGRGVAVNVSRDLKICHFPQDAAPLFLRILRRPKGEVDFRHLQELGRLLGRYVNAPVDVVRTDDLICGVFPYVTHERVSLATIAARQLLPQVRDVLAKLHAGGAGVPVGVAEQSHTAVVDHVGAQPRHGAAFARYFGEVFLPIVGRLPPVPQHGDFTYVNCSTTDDGRLIVFDWEDYGLVRCPGFDLATFVVSHWHHGRGLEVLARSPQVLTSEVVGVFGPDVFGCVGLDAATFARLFPGYIGIFLTVKSRGFGRKINDRMRRFWAEVMGSVDWQPTLQARGD